MVLLGIIACRMFEDELAYLIENDCDISKIILLDNGEPQKTFEQKLKNINKKYYYSLSIEDLNSKIEDEDPRKITLFIELIKLGLHATPKLLKEEIYRNVNKIKQKTYIKNLFLFYGLCGNVLGNIEKDLASHNFNIRILKEKNGNIVDDCIGATLNGRANYLKVLKSFHKIGTLILTPMGSITTKDMFEEQYINSGITYEKAVELNKMMFKMCNYKQVTILDTELNYTNTKKIQKEIKYFTTLYHLKIIDKIKGTQILFIENYLNFKSNLI